MGYHSILTVWEDTDAGRAAFDAAIELTRREAGHLDVLCLGVNRAPSGFYGADMSFEMSNQLYGQSREEAAANAAAAKAAAEPSGVSFSTRTGSVKPPEMGAIMRRAGWFQDLIVVARPFGEEDVAEPVLDAALFETLAPVLIAPAGGTAPSGGPVLVAWNGSPEAMRATRAALPLLKAAKTVEVALIDPERHAAGEADPGSEIGAMLARHGVAVEVNILAQTGASVAETMLQRATDIGAEMLVMGGYGHSRFRERLVGGATRDMLKSATLPVLMAH